MECKPVETDQTHNFVLTGNQQETNRGSGWQELIHVLNLADLSAFPVTHRSLPTAKVSGHKTTNSLSSFLASTEVSFEFSLPSSFKAKEAMASKQMVYMNQGQGQTSYARNSSVQVYRFSYLDSFYGGLSIET
jgi:hypothetical protein